MSDLPSYEVNVFGTPPVRTWQQGWDDVGHGFYSDWRRPSSKQVYQELYRALTHGYTATPDEAFALLSTAFTAAESEVYG